MTMSLLPLVALLSVVAGCSASGGGSAAFAGRSDGPAAREALGANSPGCKCGATTIPVATDDTDNWFCGANSGTFTCQCNTTYVNVNDASGPVTAVPTSFNFPDPGEFIQLFDGDRLLETCTGTTCGQASSSGPLTLAFHDSGTNLPRGDASFRFIAPVPPSTTTTTTAAPVTSTAAPFVCGQTYDLNIRQPGQVLVLNSPGFPGYYPNTCTDTWYVAVSSSLGMTLSFTDVDLEQNYDNVKVYEGIRLMETCSGATGCNDVSLIGGSFRIVFTSDRSVQRHGFRATVTGFAPSTTTVSTAAPTPSPCRQTLTLPSDGSAAHPQTPHYPALRYPNNLHCHWIIKDSRLQMELLRAPSAGLYATVELRDLKVEDGADFVRIYDGPNANPANLKVICTGYETCPPYTSSSGAITVTFDSDASNQDTGFSSDAYASQPPLCSGPGLRALDAAGTKFSICEMAGAAAKIGHCWGGKVFSASSQACV